MHRSAKSPGIIGVTSLLAVRFLAVYLSNIAIAFGGGAFDVVRNPIPVTELGVEIRNVELPFCSWPARVLLAILRLEPFRRSRHKQISFLVVFTPDAAHGAWKRVIPVDANVPDIIQLVGRVQ